MSYSMKSKPRQLLSLVWQAAQTLQSTSSLATVARKEFKKCLTRQLSGNTRTNIELPQQVGQTFEHLCYMHSANEHGRNCGEVIGYRFLLILAGITKIM